MPHIFLRRVSCGTFALALLCAPCAAGSSQTAHAAPTSAAVSRSDALAPIESALDALRRQALEWLDGLRPSPKPAPDDSVRYLIPSGQNIGVALMCEGVLVIGTSDPGSVQSPARLAGIRSGDMITHVDGEPVVGSDSFRQMISDGDAVTLTVCRDETSRTVELEPVIDAADGEYRIGAWVRDSTAGIGTLTFIDPATASFGALGHPIQDADTYATLPVAQGLLFDSDVVGVRPGQSGAPGELVGSFMENADGIGEIDRNTSCGIFGRYTADYDEAAALPAACSEDIAVGSAYILTTLDGSEPQAYDIEIVKLYADGGASSRSMMIEVTDPDLLSVTGGIVQGMSGSPVIQNGRIVGAVTHVLVNDPTRGYGIFIENMLNAAR